MPAQCASPSFVFRSLMLSSGSLSSSDTVDPLRFQSAAPSSALSLKFKVSGSGSDAAYSASGTSPGTAVLAFFDRGSSAGAGGRAAGGGKGGAKGGGKGGA